MVERFPLPSGLKYGFVVGRFVEAVPDGSDEDRLPDGVSIAGPVELAPVVAVQGAVDYSALVKIGKFDAAVDGRGELRDASGELGMWLPAGRWHVRIDSMGIRRAPVIVTEEHTVENPLDLKAAILANIPPDEVPEWMKLRDQVAGFAAVARASAEAAEAVDATTIQAGEVVGDDLVLTRNDGATVNAGKVRGGVGPQGLPGVNAVPGDEAVAGWIGTEGSSASQDAVDARVLKTVAEDGPVKDSLKSTIGDAILEKVSSASVTSIRTTFDPDEMAADGELLLLLPEPALRETFPIEGAGLPDGWSQRFSSSSPVTVTSAGMVVAKADTSAELFSWDAATTAVGGRADVEALAKVSLVGATSAVIGPMLYLRGSGVDVATRGGVAFGWRGGSGADKLRIYRYVDGSPTSLAQGDTATPASGQTFWLRFQAQGDQVRGRMWLDGGAEPSTWDLTATVPVLDPGYIGLYTQRNTAQTVEYFSVGYNGFSAPMPL